MRRRRRMKRRRRKMMRLTGDKIPFRSYIRCSSYVVLSICASLFCYEQRLSFV
jgi:hypothetical protein